MWRGQHQTQRLRMTRGCGVFRHSSVAAFVTALLQPCGTPAHRNTKRPLLSRNGLECRHMHSCVCGTSRILPHWDRYLPALRLPGEEQIRRHRIVKAPEGS
jgi:hypothetical protein